MFPHKQGRSGNGRGWPGLLACENKKIIFIYFKLQLANNQYRFY
jgi:hypothetical protein